MSHDLKTSSFCKLQDSNRCFICIKIICIQLDTNCQYIYLNRIIALAAQSWRHSELDLTTKNDGTVKPNYSGNLNITVQSETKKCSIKYAI